MASTDQINRFNKALDDVIAKTLKIDDDAARRTVERLRVLRRRIAGIVAEFELNPANLESIQNAVIAEFLMFDNEMGDFIDKELSSAIKAGQNVVDRPLLAAGVNAVEVGSFAQLPPEVFEAQIARSTKFITNLTADAANKINAEIRLAILGEQSTFQTMKRIGNVGIDRSTFNTIADRAETIVRTEVNTALNQGTIQRMEAADRRVEGMKKFWLDAMDGRVRPSHRTVGRQTNPEKGGRAIPVKKDFRLLGARGIERAKGPQDPRLSAGNSIRCRCRLGFKIDERTRI